MSIIGNLLWIVFGGGIFLFFFYLIGGLALCLTIVGIPFGVQCIKLSFLALVPFGQEVVDRASAEPVSIILNIVWILFGGIWLTVTHLVFALLCGVTIIGIPFSLQHFKLMKLSLTPFGKEIR
ncbi:MAG: YccF domain-containing protein [Firmicutes bacterium]|nr:YccF domain-containing protein [Bacillota bacterium]